MVKEKLFFWPLLVAFLGILAFGINSHSRTKKAVEGLISEIDASIKYSSHATAPRVYSPDAGVLKNKDEIANYKDILKRSPFFRVVEKRKIEKVRPIPAKEIKKKSVLKYKGKVMMGDKVKVIIEDETLNKSFFVEEGDTIGDFLVWSIDDRKIILKKKGGEEVILSAVKKKGGKVSGNKKRDEAKDATEK